MTKLRPTQSLLLLLIVAFVTMQWSVTHIHLADQHDHDGSQHQHQAEGHAHHPLSHHSNRHNSAQHHADAFDTAQPEDNLNVVELDHDCHSPNGKLKTPDHALIASYAWLTLQPSTHTRFFAVASTAKTAHLQQSTIQLRAPPQHT